MNVQYQLPPNPQHAVLKRIYPWDEYDLTLVMNWLYAQARKTGFSGTLDDFKLRYGAFVEATDPQEVHDLIDNYEGIYHIVPLQGIEQVLKTKNKVLNDDIVIEAIPSQYIKTYEFYSGNYSVTPLAFVDQLLRTNDKVMEQNVVVEKIPYATTSNVAGGYTAIIG